MRRPRLGTPVEQSTSRKEELGLRGEGGRARTSGSSWDPAPTLPSAHTGAVGAVAPVSVHGLGGGEDARSLGR